MSGPNDYAGLKAKQIQSSMKCKSNDTVMLSIPQRVRVTQPSCVFLCDSVFLSDVTNEWCYDGPFRREQKKRIPFVQYIVDCRSRTTRIRAVLNMTLDSNNMDNQYLYFKRG